MLDYELVPIFNELRDSLNIYNLDDQSKTYKDACGLLTLKFNELKILLSSLDSEKKFKDYLKSKPKDSEIYQLFIGCWRKPFIIDSLSLKFLELSRDRLCKEKGPPIIIEHLNKVKVKNNFILEIPKEKFTEKMINYFNKIQSKLPCFFDDIFEDDKEQIEIYENFVYLLHLLQQGKIKYQKDTKTLYK